MGIIMNILIDDLTVLTLLIGNEQNLLRSINSDKIRLTLSSFLTQLHFRALPDNISGYVIFYKSGIMRNRLRIFWIYPVQFWRVYRFTSTAVPIQPFHTFMIGSSWSKRVRNWRWCNWSDFHLINQFWVDKSNRNASTILCWVFSSILKHRFLIIMKSPKSKKIAICLIFTL